MIRDTATFSEHRLSLDHLGQVADRIVGQIEPVCLDAGHEDAWSP
jgi:hypothetical protein